MNNIVLDSEEGTLQIPVVTFDDDGNGFVLKRIFKIQS